MTNYDAGVISANGITVPIQVTDGGDWRAEYDGRDLKYPTREKLEASLKRLTKRAAVTVQVAVVKVEKSYQSARGTRATATGIHGANGNVLVTLHVGGRRGDVKEQVSVRYSSSSGLWFGGDVTDEQLAEFDRLVRAEHDAKEAVRKFQSRMEINLLKAVETAVSAHTPEGE